MMNVNIGNFETEVLAASAKTPVLVDFWAPWCGPCQSLGPLLEKLEQEYAGRFILAKIDSDQEQQLAAAFGIRSIPTCVLMLNGEPVDGFMGALPEGQIRAFLDKNLAPAAAQEDGAQELEQEPAQEHEDQPSSAAPDPATVAALDKLSHIMGPMPGAAESRSALEERLAKDKRDFAARYFLAQHHMAAQNWTAAMDALLEILMRDKNWNQDQARLTYIAILDVLDAEHAAKTAAMRPAQGAAAAGPGQLGIAAPQLPAENPTIATYRRRLSSVILS